MKVEFTVKGSRPPRKRDAKSLWAHPKEAPLVLKLRRAALEAGTKLGTSCITSTMKLELNLYTPDIEGVGDLDSYISGICDGLQAADQNVEKFDAAFQEAEDINPRMSILINNDKNIVHILATKEKRDFLGYRVAVEEA